MPIRALLMDIDDTLFDFQTSSRNALSIAFRAFGLPFTPEMWERYRALDAELWQRFERGEITKRHSMSNASASFRGIRSGGRPGGV